LFSLCKLYEELVVKRGMSIEQVANSVDIALHKLPYMEGLYQEAKEAVDRVQDKRDYLSKDIISLRKELIELEDEKQKRKVALSPIIIPIMETEKILQGIHFLLILTLDNTRRYRIRYQLDLT
jgi:hypothetical protein